MTAHRASARRRFAAVTAVLTAAVVLTACGGGDENATGHDGHDQSKKTEASAAKDHNAEDVSFAQGMIPHHRQAVQMAGLAATRAASPKVKSLSEDIDKAQGPEIKTMSGWLKSWNEEVPEDMPGMDHSGHAMPGMMTPEDMNKLKKASGEEFDTAFLKMMVEHHKGAVSMAETEKSKGSYKPAKEMADEIIDSQNAEIKQMDKLLGK